MGGISHCCNCFEPVIGRRAEEEKLPGCDPAPKKEGGQGCDCRTEELIETKQMSDGTFSETGNKVLVSVATEAQAAQCIACTPETCIVPTFLEAQQEGEFGFQCA